jgi:fermentation-respiration switch protein FrsA (DUF1100 family)
MMRREVVFPSRGLDCKGWLFLPTGVEPGQKLPAIAMAHGLSAVKEMCLAGFAERFAAAGLAALVFDFRCLGESQGEPRGQVFPHEQQEDYRNAISWLARRPEVDPDRIGAWGTSFSGGHVLQLAAFDRRIKAAVVQVPALNVWRQVLHSGGRDTLQGLLGLVTADRIARFESGAVNTLQVVAPPGELCIMSAPDAYEWFQQQGAAAPTWINQITIESLERMIEYAPADAIELISPTPLLAILAEHDSLVSTDLASALLERAGEPKQIQVLACGHFDVYGTEPWFTRAAGAAADWFETHLG